MLLPRFGVPNENDTSKLSRRMGLAKCVAGERHDTAFLALLPENSIAPCCMRKLHTTLAGW